MKLGQEQFKIELVVRDRKCGKRKFSADYRFRDRLKERQYTPIVASQKMRESISVQKDKSGGCLNTIFHKERQSKQFSEKCMNLLSKKKIAQKEQSDTKCTNFNTMLQNIKNVIKQNEKKERQVKIQQQPLCNNQFQCIRSQIHQIYSNEEKIELYRMLRTCQSRNSRNYSCKVDKSDKIDKSQVNTQYPKVLNNQFFNLNTVVCFTMALNDPCVPKKTPLFQAPILRSTFATSSASGKRVIHITKPFNQKSMTFNMSNDGDSQYAKKLKNFFEFLFKVNYSNNIYVSLEINKQDQTINSTKYRIYIGKGNNSLLVKSLIKRRFWWQIAETADTAGINFYWSQNIIEDTHNRQLKSIRKISNFQKKTKKIRQNEQVLDLNRKILPAEKCRLADSYINKEGFIIPFDDVFVPDLITNHLPRNYCIGSKKNLFKSLLHYFTKVRNKNPFDYIPKTYHIKSTQDSQYRHFIRQNQQDPQKVWIVKPGQNTNRGKGIKLATFSSVHQLIKKIKHDSGQPFTYIVQSYINRPFLYNNRKFDIRHYMLLTSVNGILKAYWYKQGYIRTSSQIFDLQDLDNEFLHLTNDAIQRNSQDYQKYQPANKLSYSEFQRYLDYTYPSRIYNFQKDILPKMKQMANYIVKANYQTIDHRRHLNNFEIFGLDFMIDRDFKPWLIEVNYNPCLEVNCPILQRIIPAMLQNSLRLALDPLFPPTTHFPASKRFYLSDNYLKNLKYQLIFDEDNIRYPIQNVYDFVDQKQEEEQYQNEGQQVTQLLV